MTLRGTAFLALWNDVAPLRDAEYNDWHTREHVPERLTVPGILGGRRYSSPRPRHQKYFTLYELQTAEVLASAPYRRIVDEPSAWSRSMRPDLCNFVRRPCATLFSQGIGVGGGLLTICVAAKIDSPLVQCIATAKLRSSPVIAVHVGSAEETPFFPVPGAITDEAGPQTVWLVEGRSRDELDLLEDQLVETLATSGAVLSVSSYDLAFLCGPAA
jgi:hypothetical protein